MRQGLRTILELESGFQVVGEAADGKEAVSRYQELCAQGSKPDIVLMDVQMPHMDGYEAAAHIRALDREDTKSMPIVAMTANAFQEDMDKTLSAGMNDHVTKPIEIATLMKVLGKYLN